MRFASANKNTAANIINAGAAAGNAASSFLESSRANATNFTNLARTNIKAGYDTQSKAIQYDAEVKANKMKNKARTEGYEMILDARSSASKEVRKAGMLAGFGKLAMAAGKKRKKTSPPVDAVPVKQAVLPEEKFDAEAWLEENPRPESNGTISTEGGGTTPETPEGVDFSRGVGDIDLSKLTEKDWKDLGFVVSGEAARGTKDEYGVAASVLNRVASDKFPNTIGGVIHSKGQYAAIEDGGARHEPELVSSLSSETGRAEILKALEKLQGRTDFKGQALLGNRSSKGNPGGELDPMFDPKGNFYHYAGQT